MSEDGENGSTNGTDETKDGENGHSTENGENGSSDGCEDGENGNGQGPVDEDDSHFDDATGGAAAAAPPVGAPRDEAPGIMGSLAAFAAMLTCALGGTAILSFATDAPHAGTLGVNAASAGTGTAACASGPGALLRSDIVLACQAFQNTQLPNVFPEVPPAVATPTPAAPAETPTPAPSTSSSSSTQSSHTVTPPPPPTPPPANCVPTTMTVTDTSSHSVTYSSGSSDDKTFHFTSNVAADHSITFSISGLIHCNSSLQHHIVYASGSGTGGFGTACNAQPTSTVTAGPVTTYAPSEDWTIHVYASAGDCSSAHL
jgi:hypothetical protein